VLRHVRLSPASRYYCFFAAFRFRQNAFIRAAAAFRCAGDQPRRPGLDSAASPFEAADACDVAAFGCALRFLPRRTERRSGKADSMEAISARSSDMRACAP
jgi:hypothetical protein